MLKKSAVHFALLASVLLAVCDKHSPTPVGSAATETSAVRGAATGTVLLSDSASVGGGPVMLASRSSGLLQPPARVTVSEGAQPATFRPQPSGCI